MLRARVLHHVLYGHHVPIKHQSRQIYVQWTHTETMRRQQQHELAFGPRPWSEASTTAHPWNLHPKSEFVPASHNKFASSPLDLHYDDSVWASIEFFFSYSYDQVYNSATAILEIITAIISLI